MTGLPQNAAGSTEGKLAKVNPEQEGDEWAALGVALTFDEGAATEQPSS